MSKVKANKHRELEHRDHKRSVLGLDKCRKKLCHGCTCPAEFGRYKEGNGKPLTIVQC